MEVDLYFFGGFFFGSAPKLTNPFSEKKVLFLETTDTWGRRHHPRERGSCPKKLILKINGNWCPTIVFLQSLPPISRFRSGYSLIECHTQGSTLCTALVFFIGMSWRLLCKNSTRSAQSLRKKISKDGFIVELIVLGNF
jgi:hypothetical protein